MTWAQIITALDADLVTAGASLTPPITAIRQGEPDTISYPVIAYWYGGDRESLTGGNTLTETNIEESVLIRCYWPGSIRADSLDSSLEVQVRNAKAAIETALWGDFTLGGSGNIGLTLDDTQSGWAVIGNAVCRIVEITLWIDLAWVDVIAP